LEDGTGATEGVEQVAGGFGTSGEIDENLGEFGREHTDEGVAGGASLVTFGVGGDILGTDTEGGIFLVRNDFDMIGFFAELIMMGGGGGKCSGGIVGYDADRAAVALEDRFEFEGLHLSRFGGGLGRII